MPNGGLVPTVGWSSGGGSDGGGGGLIGCIGGLVGLWLVKDGLLPTPGRCGGRPTPLPPPLGLPLDAAWGGPGGLNCGEGDGGGLNCGEGDGGGIVGLGGKLGAGPGVGMGGGPAGLLEKPGAAGLGGRGVCLV